MYGSAQFLNEHYQHKVHLQLTLYVIEAQKSVDLCEPSTISFTLCPHILSNILIHFNEAFVNNAQYNLDSYYTIIQFPECNSNSFKFKIL